MAGFGEGTLRVGSKTYRIHRLAAVEEAGLGRLSRLPRSIRVLLENLLRFEDGVTVVRDDIAALASWRADGKNTREIAYRPARVVLQDLTGVPAVVDLAVMRDAMAELGGDAKRINPLRPADLVIDHSVQVDFFGTDDVAGAELEARVRAQHRALRVPALGTVGVPVAARGAARDGDRPPGQPRVSRAGRLRGARGRRLGRVPRHLRRHRLAHHDDRRASAWSAGAWAGSRPRRACSASRSRC